MNALLQKKRNHHFDHINQFPFLKLFSVPLMYIPNDYLVPRSVSLSSSIISVCLSDFGGFALRRQIEAIDRAATKRPIEQKFYSIHEFGFKVYLIPVSYSF